MTNKTVLFRVSAGSVILALVVGGWVTGGSAREMAEKSAAQARQELAAVVCVNRFVAAPDAHTQLAGLKEMTSSYKRGKFVEDRGWAMIVPAGSTPEPASPVRSSDRRKAAGLCAEELA